MDRNSNKSIEQGNEVSFKVWRIVAVAASLVLYAYVFAPLFQQLGEVTGALCMFPVALGGLLLGLRCGIPGAVVTMFLNFVLFSFVGAMGWSGFVSSVPAHLSALLVGGLTGWLSELLKRVTMQARGSMKMGRCNGTRFAFGISG